MSFVKNAVVAGSAMFAMFFGAGNIVFSILVGKAASANYMYAIFGWFISAVLIVMIGFYGSMIYDCDNSKYLRFSDKNEHSKANVVSSIFVRGLIFLISLINILAAARCIIVSYEGFNVLYSFFNSKKVLFSALYTAIVVLIAYKPDKIVDLMGKIFTPVKLGGISVIAILAYIKAPRADLLVTTCPFETFSNSFKCGYQTLDFISSFVIAGLVLAFLKKSMPQQESMDAEARKTMLNKFILASCVVCGIILTFLYFVLLSVGAKYSIFLDGVDSSSFLTKIAEISIGGRSAVAVACIIFVSCLSSAVSLLCIVTEYVHETILKKKLSRTVVLLVVGFAMLAVSLVAFGDLMQKMGLVLCKICPILILCTLVRVIKYHIDHRTSVM